MLIGCSENNDNENISTLLKDKESTLTAQEKIRELAILTNGSYDQLACILNASPSTLKRLNDGETFATPEAEIDINKYYNYFFVKGNSIKNFKAGCISYSWYNHVKIFMSNWQFWIVSVVILFLLAVFGGSDGLDSLGFLALMFIVYLIVWVIDFFGGTPDYGLVQDNFVNTIDTYWESQI